MHPDSANIGIDDAFLVERCRRGDRTAMGGLIAKYQHRIYNVIIKICGNADDAAELTQDTFVKIIENIDKFESKSSFYTWAFRIAVNLTLNYCQRNIRGGTASLDAEQQDADAKGTLRDVLADESSPDPAFVAANKELCKLVMKALGKLADEQRAVVVLRDIEGMDYAQIANVLDIELGTVRSRLSRGRSSLRRIMEDFCK